jgi:hypothetical protein
VFYRIYPLGPDGRFLPPVEADFASDDAALAEVGRMDLFPHGCEVWSLTRFVGRYRAAADGRLARIDAE